MRKYRSNASSTVRFEYGIELAEGLVRFPETVVAGVDFEKLNGDLEAQHQKRRALRAPFLKARVKARFAERHVDQVIRSAARAAEIADGGRRGRISTAMFPEGIRPVVAPFGKGQVKPTQELVDRLEHTKLGGIDAYRAEWLPKVKTALAELEAAIAGQDIARMAHDDAFKVELALREVHVEAVDKIMGIVRAAFPRDRAAQDLIFPEPEGRDGREGEATMQEEPVTSPVVASPK